MWASQTFAFAAHSTGQQTLSLWLASLTWLTWLTWRLSACAALCPSTGGGRTSGCCPRDGAGCSRLEAARSRRPRKLNENNVHKRKQIRHRRRPPSPALSGNWRHENRQATQAEKSTVNCGLGATCATREGNNTSAPGYLISRWWLSLSSFRLLFVLLLLPPTATLVVVVVAVVVYMLAGPLLAPQPLLQPLRRLIPSDAIKVAGQFIDKRQVTGRRAGGRRACKPSRLDSRPARGRVLSAFSAASWPVVRVDSTGGGGASGGGEHSRVVVGLAGQAKADATHTPEIDQIKTIVARAPPSRLTTQLLQLTAATTTTTATTFS